MAWHSLLTHAAGAWLFLNMLLLAWLLLRRGPPDKR